MSTPPPDSTPDPSSQVAGVSVARRPLSPATFGIWAVGALLILGAVGLRVRNNMVQAARAETQINLHDAESVLEARLKSIPKEQHPAAIRKYIHGESQALRYIATDRLAKDLAPDALDLVEQEFNDDYSEARKRAMEVLIDMPNGTERGLRLLLAGLRDEDSWVREAAVMQIKLHAARKPEEIGKRVVPGLVRALEDSDMAVASMASMILGKLEERPWKFSSLATPRVRNEMTAQWQRWWAEARKTWNIPTEYFDVPPRYPTHTDPAPEFTEIDLDGHAFRSSDLRGKITLINFWGTWCPPCRAEIPGLIKISETYRDRNVVVVGVARSEPNTATLRNYCKAHGVAYRQTQGENGIGKGFSDVEDVPVTFLIDPAGRIRNCWDGDRDYETFRAAVDRLIREPNQESSKKSH